MKYTEEDIKSISQNQLNSKYYDRTLVALNGLSDILSKEWVEKELAYFYTDPELIQALGKDRMYRGIGDLEKVVFLWEDLELLKKLNGFDNLIRKLKNGLRFENIDLEISIAADFIRLNAQVELEPLVNNGNKKADCKFKSEENIDWTFVEITRKQSSTTQKLIDDRGNELAKLVSSINTERRCVLVIKTELDEIEYNRLIEWLKSKPNEGEFENKAVFFSVPHNVDDSRQALKHAKTPISVRSGSQNLYDNSFGVVYLHIPDYGAEKKLINKQGQLPINEQGILFIDLTSVSGGFEDWTIQIVFTENLEHFSAVVLLRDFHSSNGFAREIKLIENTNSKNPLPRKTIEFIENFHLVRTNKNLMTE
jgi:hypothetical protein